MIIVCPRIFLNLFQWEQWFRYTLKLPLQRTNFITVRHRVAKEIVWNHFYAVLYYKYNWSTNTGCCNATFSFLSDFSWPTCHIQYRIQQISYCNIAFNLQLSHRNLQKRLVTVNLTFLGCFRFMSIETIHTLAYNMLSLRNLAVLSCDKSCSKPQEYCQKIVPA